MVSQARVGRRGFQRCHRARFTLGPANLSTEISSRMNSEWMLPAYTCWFGGQMVTVFLSSFICHARRGGLHRGIKRAGVFFLVEHLALCVMFFMFRRNQVRALGCAPCNSQPVQLTPR